MVEMRLLSQSCSLATALIYVVIVIQVSYLVSAYSSIDDLLNSAMDTSYNTDMDMPDEYPGLDILPAEKRYARLSYNYGNYRRGGHRRRYYNSRYYRSRYYANWHKPWLNLPDKECFRQRCTSDRSCCRRYSKCDKSANVCYGCWYGHPCKTSRDCCQRFPYCNSQTSTCQA